MVKLGGNLLFQKNLKGFIIVIVVCFFYLLHCLFVFMMNFFLTHQKNGEDEGNGKNGKPEVRKNKIFLLCCQGMK
jgi:hypothetical protein